MAENRQYDHEYKVQVVKLAKEIQQAKAAKQLGIPNNTMYGWGRANRLGNLDLGAGSQTPQSAMTLNEELILLLQQVKKQEKESRRLKKKTTFWKKPVLFSLRAVSSQQKPKNEVYCIKNQGRRIKREYHLFVQNPSCQQTGVFTSTLQTKTAHGNISRWRMP